MKYIIRILRVLVFALLLPLMIPVFCLGCAMMPLIYISICTYFYIKDGNNKNSDYYTNIVFYFLIETMWEWLFKHILKLE